MKLLLRSKSVIQTYLQNIDKAVLLENIELYRKDVLQIHISYTCNYLDNIEGNVMLAFSYK